MKSLFLILISVIATPAWNQGMDYNWLIGYADSTPEPNDGFGISDIVFSTFGKSDTFDNPFSKTFFDGTDVSISNESGRLLFYFDGFNVYDSTHQIMMNGDSLTSSPSAGLNVYQGAVIIPIPGSENLYGLFHIEGKYVDPNIGYIGTRLYRTMIDMNSNDGRGAVIERQKIVLENNLCYGRITAVKHANGRDWWILLPNQIQNHSTGIYSILISNVGVQFINFQEFTDEILTGLGQAAISPDGTQYAICNTFSLNTSPAVSLFGFDRCTGGMYDQRNRIFMQANVYSTGLAFSNNSRFLYLTAYDRVYQFDTDLEDPLNNEDVVATYDGFTDSIFPVPTWFYLCQLAADGRIYISIPNGARYLHRIDFPDYKGNECRVIQHGTQLPNYNGGSLPYFPNYRLGPIDGSICDSIDINNFPKANFRTDKKIENNLSCVFLDLSSYEPTSWIWDFGDGNSSFEQNPSYQYNIKGKYNVCLSVSNANGSDTACDSLDVDGLTMIETQSNHVFSVFPIPCEEYIIIKENSDYGNLYIVELSDLLGNKLISEKTFAGENILHLNKLTPGNYIIQIKDKNKILFTKKICKI